MDQRIPAFIAELDSGASVDLIDMRHRIVAVFDDVTEEEDRVALLTLLHGVVNLAIRTREEQGADTKALREALLADKRPLVLQEAMGPDERVEPTEMLRILEREIAARRMEADDFYQLAVDGAKVLGSSQPRAKVGLIKRIFG